MKREKCYIAGKIGGLTVEEFMANFAEAKNEVIALGFEPVSPVDLPHNHNRSWEAYMKEDIISLMQCTHLYACRNWRTSPGATIEINLALQLGINVIHQTPRREKVATDLKTIVHWSIKKGAQLTESVGACGKKFTVIIDGEVHGLTSYASEVTCPDCLTFFERLAKRHTAKL